VKSPKAVAKITDDLDQLLAFYDHPAEHRARSSRNALSRQALTVAPQSNCAM
jgi:hypothetical protein